MYLTGREIKDLAEYAGFSVEVEDPDHLEIDYNISDCPKKGVADDDGKVNKYNYVVTCEGCDPGECLPLGEPIETCHITELGRPYIDGTTLGQILADGWSRDFDPKQTQQEAEIMGYKTTLEDIDVDWKARSKQMGDDIGN